MTASNPKAPDYQICNVTDVESVESKIVAFTSCQSEITQEISATKLKNGNVEGVEKRSIKSLFATLVTFMRNQNVEDSDASKHYSEIDFNYFPRQPRLSRDKNSDGEDLQYEEEQLPFIYDWLGIALSEGHIEPSQPCVGRIVGWPCRSFALYSLFVDFEAWYRKHTGDERDCSQELFYTVLDKVFIRDGDRYEFPPLPVCRERFEFTCEEKKTAHLKGRT